MLALLAFAAPLGCDEAPPADTSAARADAAARWRVGEVHRYAAAWQVDTDLALAGLVAGAGGQVHMQLAGELTLRVLPGPGGRPLIGLAWARLDAATLEVLGGAAWEDREAAARQLVGPEVVCELADDGAVVAAYFRPDAPPLFRHLMSGLLVHADLRLPAHGRALEVAGGAGVARARYTRDEAGAVRRELIDYADVRAVPEDMLVGARVEATGEAVTRLGARAVPDAIEAREEVRVVGVGDAAERYATRARFTMHRTGTTRFEPGEAPALGLMVRQIPGEPVDDPEAARQLAARFAGGMTIEVMLAELAGTLPDAPARQGFIVETTGLLRAEPDRAEALVPLMIDPATTAHARARIADVLAAAGTPQAQAALLRGLDDAGVRADAERFPRLFERLSFVRAPEPETVAYALREHRRAADAPDGVLYRTTLYVLGSLGRGIAAREPALAATAHAELVGRLELPRTGDERLAALAGLGNFASEDDAPRIVGLVGDDDPAVRAQAAVSLRHLGVPTARAALVGLIADAEPTVALRALAAFDGGAVTPAEATAVVDHLEAGRVSPLIVAALLNAFVRWRAEEREALGPAATRGLLAAAAATNDPEQRRHALALAEGAGDPAPAAADPR